VADLGAERAAASPFQQGLVATSTALLTVIFGNLERMFYDRMPFLTLIVEYVYAYGSDLTSAKQPSEQF